MQKIEPQGDVSVCPACGYRDGFHVALNFQSASGQGQIHLICPACHQHYDPGWEITVSRES